MKYLLDTNICIYIIKKKPEQVISKFKKIIPGRIAISAISVSELLFGVANSSRIDENTVALEEFLSPLVVLDYDRFDARIYGKLRADLQRKGLVIGSMDMLIAAQALNRGLTLVTNNEKEFNRIEGLGIENWAQ